MVQKLFSYAVEASLASHKQGKTSPLWDRLVFSKIRRQMGLDQVQASVTGSAPFTPELMDWVRVVLGFNLGQVYGLTETSGLSTAQLRNDRENNSVGGPTICTEIKLVDVSEMNYSVNDKPNPRGEIWIRGPMVSKGYYKADDKTAEAYFKDSDSPYCWFASGDVGEWLPNGSLRIIDRKKFLIKPPHGEYIALQKLEGVYRHSPFLLFSIVYVDGYHYDCVVIGVPNAELLTKWAKETNVPNAADIKKLCLEPAARKKVLEELQKVGRELGLKSIETVRAVFLSPEEWTPQNDMLTAAMKLNRNIIYKRFDAEIKQMYKEIEQKNA
jgi:long-chain acyl-CoA synthetase